MNAMNRDTRVTTGVGLAAAMLLFGLVLTVGKASDAQAAGPGPAQSAAPPRSAGTDKPASSKSVSPLADTRWRLVEFQSMNDAIGTTRPGDPSLYTMQLNGDGTVTMRLNCNRAKGTWSAEPSGDGTSGRFEFGPLAATRAICPPPSMDESIMAQAKYLRSYLLKDGRLYLSLMADGGIYAWEPDTGAASVAAVPAAPENGGPRNWEVTDCGRDHPGGLTSHLSTGKPGKTEDIHAHL